MNDKLRICYQSSSTAVMIDKAIFGGWEDGFISSSRAAYELSKSTGQQISKEQFIINANWLGYYRSPLMQAC